MQDRPEATPSGSSVPSDGRRLHALLRATGMVAAELSLRPVLRAVVEAARELADARCAAIGVMSRDGALADFVHVGADRSTQLAVAHAVVGAIVDRPEPLRVDDMAAHPATAGLADRSSEGRALLAVPIWVREEVYAALCVGDSTRPFTAEDEKLLVALAGTAAIAIDKARLYEDAQQRQRWLLASNEVTQQLFAEDDQQPLDFVLRLAARAAIADTATMSMRNAAGELCVAAATGLMADEIGGQVVDPERSLAGRVLVSGKPVIVSDYTGQVGGTMPLPLPIGPAMGVPLMAGDTTIAAVTVGRLAGRPPFSETEADHLAGFANHAGVALELARARADRHALLVVQDHDRIAADLHDHVIQELFATGIRLGNLTDSVHPADRRVLEHAIDALDAIVRRIRAAIYQLQPGLHSETTLQSRLSSVVDLLEPALGFRADLEIVGPVDAEVVGPLAEHVTAVVRESIANAARHAGATRVDVRVELYGDQLIVEVCDDGVGVGSPTRRSGLTNMRQRAESAGGSFVVTNRPEGGTRVRWTARTTSG